MRRVAPGGCAGLWGKASARHVVYGIGMGAYGCPQMAGGIASCITLNWYTMAHMQGIITTKAENDLALTMIARLMKADPKPRSHEGKFLGLLAEAVVVYENNPPATPVTDAVPLGFGVPVDK